MRNSRASAGFRPNGWPFGLQSRSRLGTFEPAESMEVSALGNPCETAQPQQDSGSMCGRLVCRADLVWAPLNPLKAWRVERYWRWATHAKQQSPTAGFQPKGWPFGLQRRSRLGTFEPAKSMESGEVLALGNPCETAEPLQDSGWPFGLQSRSRLGAFEPAKSMESGEVLALGNPCETAKPHSRIPAQGVAVWSAAPISFRHLRTR